MRRDRDCPRKQNRSTSFFRKNKNPRCDLFRSKFRCRRFRERMPFRPNRYKRKANRKVLRSHTAKLRSRAVYSKPNCKCRRSKRSKSQERPKDGRRRFSAAFCAPVVCGIGCVAFVSIAHAPCDNRGTRRRWYREKISRRKRCRYIKLGCFAYPCRKPPICFFAMRVQSPLPLQYIVVHFGDFVNISTQL